MLKDKAKQDSQDENAAPRGGWFKFKEGDNRIRLLTEPMVIFEDYQKGICFTGCGFKGNMKYVAYIYNYGTQQIEIMKLPMKIFDYIANLEDKEDWAFTGFPMPYSLTISAEGAGSKEVKYSVMPSPKRTEMPEDVIAALSKKTSIPEIIERLKEKNKRARGESSDEGFDESRSQHEEEEHADDSIPDHMKSDINPDDIPF